jgi:signal transduction histidine kinase/ActR/RegA family two-component response regulator
LLWESAAVLLTTDRPDSMLRGVFEKIAPHFRIDAYLNYLVDTSADTLTLESWAGIREHDAQAIRRVAVSDHLCGKVAAERRSIAVHGIQESQEPELKLARKLGFRAYAGNPLIAEGRLLGTLSFATRTSDEFRPDELEFFATICRYVTAAYERVFLIRQLRDSDHRKDEFLATLAHELRNPLAPIRNALEIMRVNGSGSAVDSAARTMIERQLEQMVRLVDDLLDVSRITQGRLELRKERVALHDVVKSALDTSRPWIEAARHELEVSLPEQALFLDADPVRLAQVFSNLLNNAARYMDRGGRIWLTAMSDDGTSVTVKVRDAGLGIDADALSRIFDMFAQASSSPDRSQGGLGVGLTLVKRLVEMHGGTVLARSEGVGAGAEFEVRLPLATEAPAHRGVEPAPSVAHAIACRVLVADDNSDAAESMGMLLRLMGNDVKIAHDGLEAVEQAADFRPDIVLMDIGMPRLNGYDAARRMREQAWSEGTMLVALTGWGQVEDKRKATEAGFDRHFTKPLDPAKLQALMDEYRAEH